MFQKFILKNFRTHTETSIELGVITLFIGANSAGKSNLLAGIRHFSRLVARGRPEQEQTIIQKDKQKEREKTEFHKLYQGDFFPHRHRLAKDEAPMSFFCSWKSPLGEVEYEIQLYENSKLEQKVGCRESIIIQVKKSNKRKEMKSGWDNQTDEIILRSKLESVLQNDEIEIAHQFFRDLASCYIYNFQSSFLKGKIRNESIDRQRLRIAGQLGYEGGNLQEILSFVQEREPRTFNRFLAFLRRFESSFHGIGYNPRKKETIWLFDLGREPARLDEFTADFVSDGLLRAAAIALLSSMDTPPALILIEEIENGISQKNLGRFIGWLRQASGTENSSPDRGYATQFILTSHSPSVLREFSDYLDNVFFLRLERRGYKSVVRNLNSSLTAFVDMGVVKGEFEMRNEKQIVKIPPDKLLELWYSGGIGGDLEP
jgi:predicted ATPase